MEGTSSMKMVCRFLAGLAVVLVLGTAVAVPVSAQRTDSAALEAKAAALSDSLAAHADALRGSLGGDLRGLAGLLAP
jgi:hypothetical protein